MSVNVKYLNSNILHFHLINEHFSAASATARVCVCVCWEGVEVPSWRQAALYSSHSVFSYPFHLHELMK